MRVLGIDLGTANPTVAQVQLPLDSAGSPELLRECISMEKVTHSGPCQKKTEAARLSKSKTLA